MRTQQGKRKKRWKAKKQMVSEKTQENQMVLEKNERLLLNDMHIMARILAAVRANEGNPVFNTNLVDEK